jgi:hypothetical protein
LVLGDQLSLLPVPSIIMKQGRKRYFLQPAEHLCLLYYTSQGIRTCHFLEPLAIDTK